MNILFDLDGTLTDSALGILRCIQHALLRLDRPVPPAESLRPFIGPPLGDTFGTLLATGRAEEIEAAIAFYRERYIPTGMFENAVYPGIAEGLERLQSDGHRLWVATSKPHVYARKIVAHFGLAPWFEGVYGSELEGANSEKTELVRHVLEREGLAAAETWMIGDRRHDIVGALHNRVTAVGVLWGYGTRDELKEAGSNHIVASMAELCEIVAGERGGTT